MKTEDLIKALAADTPMRQMPLARAWALALGSAVALSAALFFWKLGIRANAVESLATIRYPLKFVTTLALTVPAIIALYRLSRPEGRLGALGLGLVAAPALLVGSVAMELLSVPPELWGPRLVGQNSLVCLVIVPLLAIFPLAASLGVLRYGAPSQPRLAAFVAGLAAAGIGATLYASHCPDDSPLFVATWYTIATAIVVIASLAVGPRLMRW